MVIATAMLALGMATTNVRVPIETVNGIVVNAAVNGRGPFPFIVDTGASVTILRQNLLGRIGAGPTHVSIGHDGATGKAVVSESLTLSDVAIGDAHVRGVDAAALPLPTDLTYLGAHGTAAGLIGDTFLRHFAVTIDYAHRRLTLASSAVITRGAIGLPLKMTEDGVPIVAIAVDGVPARAIIDTGNVGDTSLRRSFADGLRLLRNGRATFKTQSKGVSGSTAGIALRLPALRIGKTTVHNCAATVADALYPGVDAGLGLDILNRFIVTLDFPRHMAYFVPTAAVDEYRPYAPSGLHLKRNENGTMIVSGISAHTPAAWAGFRTGDILLAVDGRPIAAMSSQELAKYVTTHTGERVWYTVLRNDRKMTIGLTPVDLLPSR